MRNFLRLLRESGRHYQTVLACLFANLSTSMVTIAVNGVRVKFDIDGLGAGDEIRRRSIMGQIPEEPIVRCLMKLAPCVDLFFDVGAHIGYYACIMANCNPHLQCYTFEMVPFLQERIKHNIRINQLSNVRCFDVVVADSDKGAFYTESGVDFFSTSVLQPRA